MKKDKLIEKMVAAMAEKNNRIDLDAYACGLTDMYEKLNKKKKKKKWKVDEFIADVSKDYNIPCELVSRMYYNSISKSNFYDKIDFFIRCRSDSRD